MLLLIRSDEGHRSQGKFVKESGVSDGRCALLPVDDGFVERMRGIDWRAQPHILDECVVSLFDDPDLDREQMVRLFLLAWIVVEVANEAWNPPEEFEGDATYTFQPLEESQ